MYKEVLVELYSFLTIGESDANPEVSTQAFVTNMRKAIDETFDRHGQSSESQELTRVATTHGGFWLRRKNGLRSLAQAEMDLESAAKSVRSLREELKAGYQEMSFSQLVGPSNVDKKRKFDDVDEQIEKASELCKRVRGEGL